jgi:hypothetical protein
MAISAGMIASELLMCGLKQVPLVGTAADFLKGLHDRHQSVTTAAKLAAVEAAVTSFDRRSRDLIRDEIMSMVSAFRTPGLAPLAFNEHIRNYRAMQAHGWTPAIFEGLLRQSPHWAELASNPSNYGDVLADGRPIDPTKVQVVIDADKVRLLELTPFAFATLLGEQAAGAAKPRIIAARDVWAEIAGAKSGSPKPLVTNPQLQHIEQFGLMRTIEADRSVNSAIFLPNGNIMWDCSLYIKYCALASDGNPRKLPGFHATDGIVGSPDGAFVLTFWSKEISIINLGSGRIVRTIDRKNGWFSGRCSINSAAISPDARSILSVSEFDDGVTLHDVASGRELVRWKTGSSRFKQVAFTLDGRYAVTASHRMKNQEFAELALWGVSTGAHVRDLTSLAHRMAVHPDGHHVLSAYSNDLRLIRLSDGVERLHIEIQSEHHVSSVAVSPDGTRALSGEREGGLRLWDLRTAQEVCHLIGHTDTVNAVAFSPDGRFALSAGNDKTVRVWALPQP